MEPIPDLARRKELLALTAQDEQALRARHAALGDEVPGLVDEFYRHLLSFEEARALIADDAMLARLKAAQSRYFHTLIAGVYDENYAAERWRVGLAHARVGLTPGWYLGAYSHYLAQCLPRMAGCGAGQPAPDLAAFRAFIKAVFLDIGLAIGSYIGHRDALVARLRDYGMAFAHLPYGTLVATAELETVFANRAFDVLFSAEAAAAEHGPLARWIDTAALGPLVRQALQQGQARQRLELRATQRALPVPVDVAVHALPAGDGGAGGPRQPRAVLLTFMDLREQTWLHESVQDLQAATDVGVWRLQFDGLIHFTPQAARLMGRPDATPPGPRRQLLECVHAGDRPRLEAAWERACAGGRLYVELRTAAASDGAARRVELRGTVLHDDQGRPARAYGIVLDVTERRQLRRRMEWLAHTDALTGLSNRTRGMELLHALLGRAQRRRQAVVVLFADLDRFKEVNDTHGHAGGDTVLAEVARRCRAAAGRRAVVARLGGDEFMLARPLAEGEDPQPWARRIAQALAQPATVGTARWTPAASIGAAVYPRHGRSADDLLRHADAAMYQAKRHGASGGIRFYDAALGLRLERSRTVAARLERALRQDALELRYQPQVDLATGALVGIEALARWHDEELGWVSPAEFVPLAEERGLIGALGDWALATAAGQWRDWSRGGACALPRVAVNVSAAQLADEAFAARAERLVHAQGAHPRAIELEITESVWMRDPDRTLRIAAQLMDAGFALSIDDFGTGYSSLARLQMLPVSKLKIDMSFVRDMLAEAGSLAIVTAVIGLARALGLRTVAEGVETQAQAARLRELGCGAAQGWLHDRALPAAGLQARWLNGRAA
ncbi:EAL domain-containing protein [Xylophilus sp.]|uniref:EAL domain-containing protein n=1 Tax=Xylophilus sp. TaxID=2653893 RepID=UPI0013B7C1E7|nr:EAL domain-containing protein [Xylophilus sp.]KAF1048100.1 MAG: putative signaling protein [Xylophilus sp.]